MQTFRRGPVRLAFSDRSGGVGAPPYGSLNLAEHVGDAPGAVAENRRLAAGRLGVKPERVVYLSQVHGTRVVTAREPWPPGAVPEADAVITDRADLVLAIMVADCTPVLLADPVAAVVGAAHAGRVGMAAGVVPATVEAMMELGADPARMFAFTGPSACGACYEVPERMRAQVAEREPDTWAVTRAGTAALDVTAGVWAQLRRMGVAEGYRSPVCTIESPDHYSHRREGVTGRFAGFVWFAEG